MKVESGVFSIEEIEVAMKEIQRVRVGELVLELETDSE